LSLIAETSETGDNLFQNPTIWIIAGVLLGAYGLRVVFQFVSHYYGHYYSFKTFTQIRFHLYSHLQNLSPKFYNNKQVGRIIERLVADTYKLDEFLAHAVPDMVISLFTLIGVTIILFIMNPILAALVIAPLPILVTIAVFQRKMRKHYALGKKKLGEVYGMLSDNLQGMKEIQVFNKQDYEFEKLVARNNEVNDHTFRGLRWSAFLKPVMDFIQGFGTVMVIVVGGYFATQGYLQAADIVAFMLYIGILYGPIGGVARAFEASNEALTSIQGVFEYLDEQSEVRDSDNAKDFENLKGHIEFKDVTFAYNDNTVLDNISFKAEAGSMVALVGETGAGKTTIAHLLARFYEIASGTISIDDINIQDMTLQSLRNHLSIVLQDVFLFNGTIAENIAYGSQTEVAHEQIIEAAKSACIHDFVDSLPLGYNTEIGERGVRLSGGQKQRLAIARALLRNTPILILDEATSSIDNTTEKYIQQAIEKLSQDKSKTIIVIAHRLSTIEKADKILFIQNGKVVEQGTHEELMEKSGCYAGLRKSI